jgi:hypothetical protein
MLSDQVRDALPEDAAHQLGASLARQGLPLGMAIFGLVGTLLLRARTMT